MENPRPKWSRVTYTREMLEKAVAESVSLMGVMRALGIRLTGGSHAHLKRRIARERIDTSHFTGSTHNRGKKSVYRLSAQQILIQRRSDQNRAKPELLRRAMLESGTAHECAGCGNPAEWRGQPLTLHVDHISSDFADCRLENLRFLCPNCHSQTPTYAGKGKRQRTGDQPAGPEGAAVDSGGAAERS
ncbi:HNH endonuclease [Longispora sp. K20-0274]|uniref:HNH endonuclease signature motif containing protein n=1 Tax=Longispora sp. K20-0274 TaxID=3088255 RepID=UPI00399B03A0